MNPEHVFIVRQGAAVIELWRQEHPEERLDLRGADLREETIFGAVGAGA